MIKQTPVDFKDEITAGKHQTFERPPAKIVPKIKISFSNLL